MLRRPLLVRLDPALQLGAVDFYVLLGGDDDIVRLSAEALLDQFLLQLRRLADVTLESLCLYLLHRLHADVGVVGALAMG